MCEKLASDFCVYKGPIGEHSIVHTNKTKKCPKRIPYPDVKPIIEGIDCLVLYSVPCMSSVQCAIHEFHNYSISSLVGWLVVQHLYESAGETTGNQVD